MIRAIKLTQRSNGRSRYQVRDIELLAADGKQIATATIPRHAWNHIVFLPETVTTDKLSLRILTSHGMPDLAIAELDIVPAE